MLGSSTWWKRTDFKVVHFYAQVNLFFFLAVYPFPAEQNCLELLLFFLFEDRLERMRFRAYRRRGTTRLISQRPPGSWLFHRPTRPIRACWIS